ncbi:MAG: phosphate acyltransferase PlsX [Planctomycetota bacterium]
MVEVAKNAIALDTMGGDHAPLEIVRGALRAVEEGWITPSEIFLVGDHERVAKVLRDDGANPDLYQIVHAPEVVEMGESPLDALRKKRKSSIVVATELVREKKAGAVVSAGHTGAATACAILRLGTLDGIKRPGIAVTLQSLKGPTLLIDVGANVDCKPIHLFQYGLMGHAYSRDVLGVANPRIALLNIGEEEAKGNRLAREAADLFRESGLLFVGNAEGQDIFRGKADVLVCDGFVGNLVLKTSEGAAEFMLHVFAQELASVMPKNEIKAFVNKVARHSDYAEYGGALLLGVDGIVIIGHGRSNAHAASAMIKTAKKFILAGVNNDIVSALQKVASANTSNPADTKSQNDTNGNS